MTTTPDFVNESFRQAADAFGQTMQAGVKFQEQTAQFWGDLFKRNTDELRTTADRVGNDTTPFARKNFDRFQRFFDEQSQRSLDLLRKSFDLAAAQPGTLTADKFMALWQSSFDALRSSTDAFARTQAEMYQNWTEWMRSMTATCCTGDTKTGPANGHTAPASRKTEKVG